MVRFSTRARRDLREILQYSAETWGSEQSDTYTALLQEATRRVAEIPAVGRAREDIRPGFRSYPVGQHVILYRVDAEAVVVLRVLHSRRDVRRALDEDEGRKRQ